MYAWVNCVLVSLPTGCSVLHARASHVTIGHWYA
jgi:hypothetical protein